MSQYKNRRLAGDLKRLRLKKPALRCEPRPACSLFHRGAWDAAVANALSNVNNWINHRVSDPAFLGTYRGWKRSAANTPRTSYLVVEWVLLTPTDRLKGRQTDRQLKSHTGILSEGRLYCPSVCLSMSVTAIEKDIETYTVEVPYRQTWTNRRRVRGRQAQNYTQTNNDAK